MIRKINFNSVEEIKNHIKACQLFFDTIKECGGTIPIEEQYYMGYCIGGDMRLDHQQKFGDVNCSYHMLEKDSIPLATIILYEKKNKEKDEDYPVFVVFSIENNDKLLDYYQEMLEYVISLGYKEIYAQIISNSDLLKKIKYMYITKSRYLDCIDIVRLL